MMASHAVWVGMGILADHSVECLLIAPSIGVCFKDDVTVLVDLPNLVTAAMQALPILRSGLPCHTCDC